MKEAKGRVEEKTTRLCEDLPSWHVRCSPISYRIEPFVTLKDMEGT